MFLLTILFVSLGTICATNSTSTDNDVSTNEQVSTQLTNSVSNDNVEVTSFKDNKKTVTNKNVETTKDTKKEVKTTTKNTQEKTVVNTTKTNTKNIKTNTTKENNKNLKTEDKTKITSNTSKSITNNNSKTLKTYNEEVSLSVPSKINYGTELKANVSVYDPYGIYGYIYVNVDGSYKSQYVYSSYSSSSYNTINMGKLSVGTHKIQAEYYSYNSYDSVYSTTKTVTVVKPRSITLTVPSTITSGSTLNSKVTVKDTDGLYGNVYIYVDGVYKNSQFVSSYFTSGTYTISSSKPSIGKHTIKAEYYSYNDYSSVYASKTMTVKSIPTSITLTVPSSLNYGNSVTETIKIKDTKGIRGYINIYIDGNYKTKKYVKSVYTTATHKINTGTLSSGKHTIKAEYYSYNTYKSVYTSKSLTVNKPVATITLTTPNSVSSKTSLTQTVKIKDTAKIKGYLYIYVDGKLKIKKYLNSKYTTGTYKFSTGKASSGTHTITAKYYSNNIKQSVKTSTYTTVKQAKVVKTVSFTKFKHNGVGVSYMLNRYDKMWVSYHKGYSPQSGRSNEVNILATLDDGFRYAKFTKAIVYYKQGSRYYSKALTIDQDHTPYYYGGYYYPSGSTCLKNNQIPYKITVYYIPNYYYS